MMNWLDFCKKVSELSDKLEKLDSELEHGENFSDALRREYGGEIKSSSYELCFWDAFERNKKYFGVPRKIMEKAINDAKADLFEQIYEVENELLVLVQEQANEN